MSVTKNFSKKLWLCDVCKNAQFEDYNDACQHEEQCLKMAKSPLVTSKETSKSLDNSSNIDALVNPRKAHTKKKKRIDDSSLQDTGNCTRKRRKTPFKQIEDNSGGITRPLHEKGEIVTKESTDSESHNEEKRCSSHQERKLLKSKESAPPLAAIFCETSKKGRKLCDKNEYNFITDCSESDDRENVGKTKNSLKKQLINRQGQAMSKAVTVTLAKFFQTKSRNLNLQVPEPDKNRANNAESFASGYRETKSIDLTTNDTKLSVNRPDMTRSNINKRSKNADNTKSSSKSFVNGYRETNSIDLTTNDENFSTKREDRTGIKINTAPVAPLFDGKSRNALLAEQRAIEFSIERRLAAEKERERQQKLFDRRSLQAATKAKTATRALQLQTKHQIARHFPLHSHVNAAAKVSTKTTGNFSVARMALCKSSKHPSGRKVLSKTLSCQLIGPNISPKTDSTFSLLSCVSIQAHDEHCRLNDSALWTEKFGIRNISCDIIGENNNAVAKAGIDFIESWKAERFKAHERRAEKQEKFSLGKKKRKKRRRDDDIWGDSDDDSQLPALFLLTGPTGCGKTSVLHAIAKHCECKVLEINTAARRDGQHLKNAIEEATLSDSTLDLLKKNISTTSNTQTHEVVDTDDEEEGQREGRAVPVILFDEVNLIFEEHGDSGFWPALKTLSKKAKCPIFLTADKFPDSIQSISTSYIHHHMDRHSPDECIQKIWQVLKSEGMKRREDVCSHKTKACLSAFAELCRCDMRRIINELQLFTCVNLQVEGIIQSFENPSDLGSFKALKDTCMPPVRVKNIIPSIVPADELTILRLEVENFNSLDEKLLVYVGDQRCPAAKVVNETTILVVCPPCKFAEAVGVENHQSKDCFSLRYPLVRIISAKQSVSLSRGACIKSRTLFDGSKLSKLSHCSIEYSLPFSNDKLELQKDISDCRSLKKKAEKLICAASDIGSTTRNVSNCTQMLGSKKTNKDEFEQLLALVKSYQLESDLNSIEESTQCYGQPFLAGSSRGFGSVLLDGLDMCYSSSSNKSSRSDVRPPGTEHIVMNGWNDYGCFFGNSDVYMTNPDRSERRELSYLACSKRNFFHEGSSDADKSSFESEDEDDLSRNCFNFQPEEDAFISRPSSIASLPDFLRRFGSDYHRSLDMSYKFLLSRKSKHVQKLTECLTCLWSDSLVIDSFPLGISRQFNDSPNFLASELEKRVYLDYCPMLSSICVFEQDSLSLPPTANATKRSTNRRTTRSSRKDTRSHYLGEKGMNAHFFVEDYVEIGQRLAAFWMEYQRD
mmetsp:Transcript_2643/g.3910  ORF Transcript_2643/g.3910 Transcript_2643/m.3910 type:complete len:1285 (-) Transcript_2643:73-3927(-)|eukprot:CAMPEP_0194248782 /NCGR_PEP_ID=MMETSP0158-20130606/19094_1 /TAXON_ID=33649 /ORGANISM="Thalassionema nitzschioides, Strain L26-B" /LENGTH=1284 /DNA_ID=CAMNT_0038985167 /DNA_START=1 /DNA_END=3855 /DNA_ORIENTATION=-